MLPILSKLLQRTRGNQLARNAGWMFLGQVLSLVIQAGYFFILARVLGNVEYGILAGAVALVSIVSQYSSLGSGLVFIQNVSSDHSKFALYWGNILLYTLTLGSALVFLLHSLGPKYIGTSAAPLLLMLGISECVCGRLTACTGQVFQAFEQLRITALLNLLTNLARFIAAAVMYAVYRHISATEWAKVSLLVSGLAAVAAVVLVTKRLGWPLLSPRLMLQRFGQGAVFALSGSTTVVFNDVDKAMLAHYGMNAANGIYSVAYRIINICNMPIESIHAAAFPRFFREGTAGLSNSAKFAVKILRRTVPLGIVIAIALVVCSPAIPFVLGKSYLESTSALQWLCLIPLFRCFHLSSGDALAGAGFQRYRLVLQLIAAGINIGTNIYLIPLYSWRGAAASSLLTDGSLGVTSWLFVLWLKKRTGRGQTPDLLAAPPSPVTDGDEMQAVSPNL